MKILYILPNNIERFMTISGWINTLSKQEHKCIPWHKTQHTAFDVFDEVAPDMLLCFINDYDESIFKCLVEQPFIRTVFFVDNYESTNQISKDLLLKSKELDIPEITCIKFKSLPGYENLQNVIYSPPAFDEYVHKNGQEIDYMKSDMIILGPVEKQYEHYVYNICKKLSNKNIKFFDSKIWNLPQYIGVLDQELIKHMIASTSAILCLGFNDLIPMTAFYNKLCICPYNELEYPNIENIDEFLSQNNDNFVHINVTPEHLENNTYKNRIQEAFSKLGIS